MRKKWGRERDNEIDNRSVRSANGFVLMKKKKDVDFDEDRKCIRNDCMHCSVYSYSHTYMAAYVYVWCGICDGKM